MAKLPFGIPAASKSGEIDWHERGSDCSNVSSLLSEQPNPEKRSQKRMDQDPRPITTAPPDSVGQAFSRATSLKCPMCVKGQLFSGMLRMNKTCDQCGFRFERDPGYFLGSTYINYGLTTLLTTWTYILLHFVIGIGRGWLIPGLATFCVIFPVVFFRYARSLWLSFDCYFDRTGALEQRSEVTQEQDPESSKEN
jgi:hypothetical protein